MSQTLPAAPAGAVAVDGTEVTYFEAGDPTSDRTPIVLIHGTAGSTAAHFTFLYPAMAVNQRVVSIDLAMPTTEEPLTVEQLRRQVVAVLEEALHGRPATLVGYSLGAVVAAATAATRPELVSALVLVAGWMRTDSQQQLFNRVWFDLRRSGSPALQAFLFQNFFGGPFIGARPLPELEPLIGMIQFDAFADRQMALNDRIDITEAVAGITAPTLVVAGTHDQMVPKRHGQALFGAIENARYAEIEAGHAVIFERAPELVRLIEHFSADPTAYPPGSVIPALKP